MTALICPYSAENLDTSSTQIQNNLASSTPITGNNLVITQAASGQLPVREPPQIPVLNTLGPAQELLAGQEEENRNDASPTLVLILISLCCLNIPTSSQHTFEPPNDTMAGVAQDPKYALSHHVTLLLMFITANS